MSGVGIQYRYLYQIAWLGRACWMEDAQGNAAMSFAATTVHGRPTTTAPPLRFPPIPPSPTISSPASPSYPSSLPPVPRDKNFGVEALPLSPPSSSAIHFTFSICCAPLSSHDSCASADRLKPSPSLPTSLPYPVAPTGRVSELAASASTLLTNILPTAPIETIKHPPNIAI